ncbi:MAG: hypothetical protein HQL56_10100, partial [Magnetococcales bacterium]|nr:hypothetical protein [Magnetococcales bacterium]
MTDVASGITDTTPRNISFNPLRSLGLPGLVHLKPEEMFSAADTVRRAGWVVYPEYWQVNALHYGFRKRLFPSINSYHLGHDKIEQTRALQVVAGVHVPQTLILPATAGAVEEVLDTLPLPLVAKVVRSSMGQGVFRIETPGQLRQFAATQEVLYCQEMLPGDRDLRVVWLGDGVVAAYWRIAAPGRFHHHVAKGGVVS